ncbi:hypothetical protein CRUP_011205 [Coryphaenoides rupestris]|nr:hypothetical protein CRUP_011205 [Coryphaenoides rupestris]
MVSFQGCGLDPRVLGSSAPVSSPEGRRSVPSVQKVALPGQVVFLSEERVSLCNVPIHTSSTRILFLSNVSPSEAIRYAWERPPGLKTHEGRAAGAAGGRRQSPASEPGARTGRPKHPAPTLLHLEVTVRSHSLLEYQAHHTDTLNQHYVYRNLIDDPDFHRRLASHASERVPYFSQLRAPGPPASPPPPPPLPPPPPPLPRPHSAPPVSSGPRALRPAGTGVALKERPRTAGAAEDPRLQGGPRHPDPHHADGPAGGPEQSGGLRSIHRTASLDKLWTGSSTGNCGPLAAELRTSPPGSECPTEDDKASHPPLHPPAEALTLPTRHAAAPNSSGRDGE